MALPQVDVTREFLMAQRQALLLQLEAIEILLAISPRTSEMRKERKAAMPPAQYNCEMEFAKKEGQSE